jgi:hypothetical protein
MILVRISIRIQNTGRWVSERQNNSVVSSPDELRGLWRGLSQPLERGGSDVSRRGAARLRGQLIHLLVQVGQPAAGQHRHRRLDPVCCGSGSEAGSNSFQLTICLFCMNLYVKVLKFPFENHT